MFTSDNGSGYRPANLPLRGRKGSVFEVKRNWIFSLERKYTQSWGNNKVISFKAHLTNFELVQENLLLRYIPQNQLYFKMRVNPNDLDDIYLQGGVRVPAFLHGPPLAQATLHKDFLFVQFSISRPIISSQTQLSIFTLSFQFSPQATLSRPRAHRSEVLAHITDWLPTLLGLAGGLLRTFCISVFWYFCIFVFLSLSPIGCQPCWDLLEVFLKISVFVYFGLFLSWLISLSERNIVFSPTDNSNWWLWPLAGSHSRFLLLYFLEIILVTIFLSFHIQEIILITLFFLFFLLATILGDLFPFSSFSGNHSHDSFPLLFRKPCSRLYFLSSSSS